MKARPATKIVKEIKVDISKCTGCRACEMACSASHARPKYSSINPARSRIRVIVDELNDEYVPIRAGDYTPAECTGRHAYLIEGKEYKECNFCGAACPSRDLFFEPDSGLPLKCDMCETEMGLDKPWCVKVCLNEALTYYEREVPRDEKPQPQRGQMEVSLESLINQYGAEAIKETLERLAKGG
jgi:benzoyl-CoA reductase subunit BamC